MEFATSVVNDEGQCDLAMSAFQTPYSTVISLYETNCRVGPISVQYPFPGAEPAFLQGEGTMLARLSAIISTRLSKEVFIVASEGLELDIAKETEYVDNIMAMLERGRM